MMHIPFNKPFMTGRELDNIVEAHANGKLAGDGPFTKRCQQWLEQETTAGRALLTHSCTAALEMTAMLLDLNPGDEIIMPAYTFVSTANAFVLRGGVPKFVDIRPDTLNLDESLIEDAITPRTKAIVPVHYAGVACEMDTIMEIARRHNLAVVEDAAQGVMANYKGRALGSIGDMGTYSFHETKNVICGEGGALLLSDDSLITRAEVIREKGTDRSQFLRGEIDKYSWVDIGSSYLPGELIAAFLWAQMESARNITERRLSIWNRYHDAFQAAEVDGSIRRPVVPSSCEHNAHMYYLLLRDRRARDVFIHSLADHDIHSVTHFVPLHSSRAGKRLAAGNSPLPITEDTAARLVRLPLWVGIENELERIIEAVHASLAASQ